MRRKVTCSFAALLLVFTIFATYKLNKWEQIHLRLWQPIFDRTDPKGAAFSMRRALLSGDAEGYVSSFGFSEGDEPLRRALYEMVLSFAKLRNELAKAYGELSADIVIRNLAPGIMPEEMIHAARQRLDQDKMCLSIGSSTKPMEMKLSRSGQNWQLDPQSAFGGLSKSEITAVAIEFSLAIEKAIPQIAQKAFSDAHAAQLAIKHDVN